MRLDEYANIEQKEEAFGQKYRYILTAQKLDEWFQEECPGALFRGVNNAMYKNYNSMQRLYLTHDLKDKVCAWKMIDQEIMSLREANNHFVEKYFKSLNITATDFTYLSYLQHYKDGVTPLLDFTKNKLVALYFMCKDARFPECGDGEKNNFTTHPISSFASVYFLEKDEYIGSRSYVKALSEALKETVESQCDNVSRDEDLKPIKKIVIEEATKKRLRLSMSLAFMRGIVGRKPFRPVVLEDEILPIDCINEQTNFAISNPNLVAQEGCFLFNPEEYLPFEKGLHCVDIHKSLIPYIKRKYLKDVYTDETMFPNMDKLISKAVENSLASVYEE